MTRSVAGTALVATLLAIGAACDRNSTASTPSQVVVAGGGGQAAPAGTVLPDSVSVSVTDDAGRPVPGVEVRFEVLSGGGFLYPAIDTTDARGVARTEWRLGTTILEPQRMEVRAIAAGGRVAATATVGAVAQARAGTRVEAVSGQAQSAAPGSALPDSLAARVLDEFGNPVAGASVRWGVPEHAGTILPDVGITGADGIARAQWVFGTISGPHVAQAVVEGAAPAVFPATATSGISVSIHRPHPTRPNGNPLWVSLRVTSTREPIARISARVAERETVLGSGSGFVNVAGLPEGNTELWVTVVTDGGDSAVFVHAFELDPRPQLTIDGPSRGTVVRGGTTAIRAECEDPSGCSRVAVYAASIADADRDRWTPVAEGATRFSGAVPLAAFNGQEILLMVQATDGTGRRSQERLGPVFVENTPAWTEVASGGLRAWDVDATRLLYEVNVRGRPVVLARPRDGGSAVVVRPGAWRMDVVYARLFDGGAIVGTFNGIGEWRGSTRQISTYSPSGRTLRVSGDWAVWNDGKLLYRRNLATGITRLVSRDAQRTGNHVASNGDVAFARMSDGEVVLWRSNGASTPISAGLGGSSPVTDGTQVVWTTGGSTYLRRGSAPELLGTVEHASGPPAFYLANRAWAAYVAPDPGGTGHVWTVAPDGTGRRASNGADARIVALGPDGTVVYATTGTLPRRFVVTPPYTAQPVDVGGALGDMRFIGGELYAFVGRSAFRVRY